MGYYVSKLALNWFQQYKHTLYHSLMLYLSQFAVVFPLVCLPLAEQRRVSDGEKDITLVT